MAYPPYGAPPGGSGYGGYPPPSNYGSGGIPPEMYGTTMAYHTSGGGGGHVSDKDRCPFFLKMGACRHGDKCTKVHQKPTTSQTVLLPMLYQNPKLVPITKHGREVEYDRKWLKKYFNSFFEEIFCLMMEFGTIIEMVCCDNVCEHLLGNVYVRYESDQGALNCVEGLKHKMWNGVLLLPELSPVCDFTDACCKEDREAACQRGLMCNFLHILTVSSSVLEDLLATQDKAIKQRQKNAGGGDRDKDREKDRDRDRDDRRRSRSPRSHRRRRSDSRDRRDHRRRRSRSNTPEPASDGRLCHICGETGHISRDCHLKRGN